MSKPRPFSAPLPLLSCVLACALACVLAWAQPAKAERRTALVIGNASYPTMPLANPVNDARDMAATLRSLGFEVKLLLNATKRDMADAARDFGGTLKAGGVGLFYFAGHGLQIRGENFLVPVDAKLTNETDAEFECMEANRLLRYMEEAKNELNIVVLDACRNNPFARRFRSANKGLAQMDAPVGSLIAFGTAPGSTASDGVGKNGLYTQSLLEHMKRPGLSLTDVFMHVRQDVMRQSGKEQVPWESSSVTGYFYFAGKPKSAQDASAAELERLNQEKERLAKEKRELEAQQQNLRREQAKVAEEKQQLASTQPAAPQAGKAAPAAKPAAPAPAAAAAPPADPDLSPSQAALAAKLRAWRSSKAESERLPIYMILTNEQMAEIVRRLPASKAALAGMSGMDMRAERYGDEILAMVRAHAPAESSSRKVVPSRGKK